MAVGEVESEGEAEVVRSEEAVFSAERVRVSTGVSVAGGEGVPKGVSVGAPVLVPPLLADEEGEPEAEGDGVAVLTSEGERAAV